MAAGDTLRRITQQDQLILDSLGNLVGVKNPNASGTDLRFDPLTKGLTGTTGNKIAIIGNSNVAQHLPLGTPDTPRADLTAYSAGTYASPLVFDLSNGLAVLRFKVTTPGTSGTMEPVWPTAAGGSVTDGTVVWTAEAGAYGPRWGVTWWHLAQAMSGQRLNEVYLVGRSGRTTTDILPYLDRALASGADIIYFANMLENDVLQVAPLSTITSTWAALSAAMDRCRSLGKRVMTQTVFPRGEIDASSVFTGYVRGNQTKAWQWLNAQIRDYARLRPDVVLFDAAYLYVDPNPSNPVWPENTVTYLSEAGAGQQLKKTDGVHPNVAAHWVLGKAMATVLAANFPAVSQFGTPADLNYVSVNPLNFGTAGTAGTGGMTGTPANLMTMFAGGTFTTAALSQVARTDLPGNWQQLNYVATAGGLVQYQHNGIAIGNLNFVAGDVVQMFSEVKVLANPTLLVYVGQQLVFSSGSPSQVLSMFTAGTSMQDLGQFITADTVFTLKTVPLAIPTGTTFVQQIATASGRGASSFTVQFGQMSVKRVLSNPALA